MSDLDQASKFLFLGGDRPHDFTIAGHVHVKLGKQGIGVSRECGCMGLSTLDPVLSQNVGCGCSFQVGAPGQLREGEPPVACRVM